MKLFLSTVLTAVFAASSAAQDGNYNTSALVVPEEDYVSKMDSADDGITSSSAGGLRGGIQVQDLRSIPKATQDKVTNIMASAPFPDLDARDRVSYVKNLNEIVDDVLVAFAQWEAGEHELEAQLHLKQVITAIESSKEARDDLTGYVEMAAEGRFAVSSAYAGAGNKKAIPPAKDDGSKKQTGPKTQRRRTKEEPRHGSGNRGDDGSKFRSGQSSNGFDFLKGLHKMMNRDSGKVGTTEHIQKLMHKRKSGASSLLGRYVYRKKGSGRRRRLSEARVEDKYHMCMQLAECVGSMTLYDTMVYFKSDDIDPTTGAMDDNTVVFDEVDLLAKYDSVQGQASDILAHPAAQSSRRMMEEQDSHTMASTALARTNTEHSLLACTSMDWIDENGNGCDYHEQMECSSGNMDGNFGLTANVACCGCGGGWDDSQAITTATEWQFFRHDSWVWDIAAIELFSSSNCSQESRLNVSGATYHSSGHHDTMTPDRPFRDSPETWGGRWDETGGSLYLGIQFPTPATVRCVRFRQRVQDAGPMLIRAKETASSAWENVMYIAHVPGSASEYETIKVSKNEITNHAMFCEYGTLSAGGGTCCSSSCGQCGGEGCTGECCANAIVDYCTVSLDTGCKAPTEIKLSLTEATNCTVEVWPGSDESFKSAMTGHPIGVYSFYSLEDVSTIQSIQVRVSGDDCTSLDVTRLELLHIKAGTELVAGEFSGHQWSNESVHGVTLDPNRRYTFDFQEADIWQEHHWAVSSAYDGPPTMAPTPTSAPTYEGFCTTGIFTTYEGNAFCCDSDCLFCGGDGCEDMGGNNNCCPETITRLCVGSDDTGCLQPQLSDVPSQEPSSHPTQVPTLAMDADLSTLCNNLLQEFHRTTENELVPKWEGGTVSQVCLAEGTQVQVKLAHAAVASADVRGFVEDASTTIGSVNTGSQWADQGESLVKVTLASDGGGAALKSTGWRYWTNGPGWTKSSYNVPFAEVDRAASGFHVNLDVNGELFKSVVGSSIWSMAQVGTSYTADKISVGRDGTVWGLETFRLCLREGTKWSCTSAATRTCGHTFRGVAVGDKDHIYLWTNDNIYCFEGWKDNEFGVAECDNNADNPTFKQIHGKAKHMSVAVGDNGQEVVYHIGTSDDIYVLDQENKYATSGSPWKTIANDKQYRATSSDGNGHLWALDYDGGVHRWEGNVNYDLVDWSNPPTFETNQFLRLTGGASAISVAANGDACLFYFEHIANAYKFTCAQALASGGYDDSQGFDNKLESPMEGCSSFDLGLAMDHFYFAGCPDSEGHEGIVKRKTPGWEPTAQEPQDYSPMAMNTDGTPFHFISASVTDDGWVWAVAEEDGRLWRAPYHGSNPFESVSSHNAFAKVSAINQTHAFAIGQSKEIIQETSNSGGAWVTRTSPAGVQWKELAAGTDGTLWAVSEDHDIYRFQEGASNYYGNAWKKENQNDDPKFLDVAVGAVDNIVGIGYVNDDESTARAYSYLSIVSTFEPLAETYEALVQSYAQEILSCAAEFFFEGDIRKHASLNTDTPWRDEMFVFGNGGGDPRIECSDSFQCDMSNYRIPIAVDVCEDDANDCGRDKFGQLIDNTHESAGFIFNTYSELLQDYKDCAYDVVAEFDGDLASELEGIQDPREQQEKFDEIMENFKEDLRDQCIGEKFGDRIDSGLELVFGKTASPGFICGMKEAVVERGYTMPGYCCLDAPYELDGDAWGHPFDCDTATTCKRMGPYFAGLSTESCDAHGGTWCPLPTDCSILMDCLEEDQDLYGEEHPAYAKYLGLSPTIRDPTDSSQCGRTRQYFGFDEFFLNDQAICDEIEELRFSKDFSFMNEFFGANDSKGKEQGSDPADFTSVYEEVEVEDIDVEGVFIQELVLPEVPEFLLGDVEVVSPGTAQEGQAWRATLHAISRAHDIAEFVKDQTEGPENMCDAISGPLSQPFRISCFTQVTVVRVEIHRLIFALQQMVEVLEFTYGEVMEQGNYEPFEILDNVKAIRGQVEMAGNYIKERANEQNMLLRSHHKLMGKALKDHHKNIGDALEEHHNNIGATLENINDNIINGATLEQVGDVSNDLAALSNDVSALHKDLHEESKLFELQVEVATNTDSLQQVFLFCAVQGARILFKDCIVSVKALVTAIDGTGTVVDLPFDGVGIDGDASTAVTGLVTLTLPDGSNASVYTFDAVYTDYDIGKEYKHSKMVSFGDSCS